MTPHRRTPRSARILTVMVVAACCLVWGSSPAAADLPALTNPPERLYFLVDSPPVPFTGTDPISGDDRELIITATAPGCAPTEQNDWALDGCARVQLKVGNGTLAIPLETTLGDPGDPDGIAPGGAIVESSQNGDGTGLSVNLNGTEQQLNDALALLTYEPDTGYEYHSGDPETLEIIVVDGTVDPNGENSISYDVEIRVQQLNDAPSLTAPTGPYPVDAETTVAIPETAPAGDALGDFFVEDPDIEAVNQDDRMLLVMFTTCGQFSLRGGSLDIDDDLTDLLTNFGFAPAAAESIVALLPGEVTSQAFATSAPDVAKQAMAAIGEFDEINYALSQVSFHATGVTNGSCDLWTIITDLGHNGLPLQYVGSPIGGRDDPQPGFEIPAAGADFERTSFVVGEGTEISLGPDLAIPEGESGTISISVSSDQHTAFQVQLFPNDIDTEPGLDYDDPDSPVLIPENDGGPIEVPFVTLEDTEDENDETLEVKLALVGQPPGVTIGDDVMTITILDDDETTTTTDQSTTTTTDGSTTTTTDGSTTTTTDGSTTTTTDGSTTTTTDGSTTTTTDGSTTTTTDGSTTTTTDGSTTTTTDGSTTTTTDGSTTTTTDGSTTTTTDGSTTTTTDGSTTTTTDGSTTTTQRSTTTTGDPTTTVTSETPPTTGDSEPTTTDDPTGSTSTTTPQAGGGASSTTPAVGPSTTAPAGVGPATAGQGGALPATGTETGFVVLAAVSLVVIGGFFLATARRRIRGLV